MSISHASTTPATGDTATLTISSHTVAGTDVGLIVKVAIRDTTDTVTGITWNTTENLSLVDRDRNGDAGTELWYLEDPSKTTADVVISMTGSNRCVGAASTYTGVDQTNPVRLAAKAKANGTNDSPTVDVVAESGEMVVDSLCQVSAGPDTAVGDHTERHDDASTGGGSDTRGASQEKASAGATETMGWTMSDADNWSIVAAPLQEPVSGDVTYQVPSPQTAISSVLGIGLTVAVAASALAGVSSAPGPVSEVKQAAGVQSAVATVVAPSLSISPIITPAVQSAVASVQAPTVLATVEVTVQSASASAVLPAALNLTTGVTVPAGPAATVQQPAVILPSVGAVMNQIQAANLGADLFDGTLIAV